MSPQAVAVVGSIAVVACACAVFTVGFVHNGLVMLRASCDHAWSDLESQLEQWRSADADTAIGLTSSAGGLQRAARHYNAAVGEYNAAVRAFPARLVARLGGLQPREFFEIAGTAEPAASADAARG